MNSQCLNCRAGKFWLGVGAISICVHRENKISKRTLKLGGGVESVETLKDIICKLLPIISKGLRTFRELENHFKFTDSN